MKTPLYPFKLYTYVEGFNIMIECVSEEMARKLLDHFQKIEPQFTFVADAKTGSHIVSFGEPRAVSTVTGGKL